MNAVSLFAGCGGLDLGADGILDVIQAHEIDRDACDVYPAVLLAKAIFQAQFGGVA